MPNDIRKLKDKLARLDRFLKGEALDIAGNEAINFAQESFQKEGYDRPWTDVKRRDSSSPWYGHQSGATSARPGKRKRKPGSITSYSPAATRRKILTGSTGRLADSFYFRRSGKGIVIKNRMPYAEVHNTGGNIKVYGRKTVRLPKRSFIGPSRELDRRITRAIQPHIQRILNS